MGKKLTPDLLNGVKHKEIVEIEHNGETYEIEIRPLKNSEAAQVRAEQWRGLKINADLFDKAGSAKTKSAKAKLLEEKLGEKMTFSPGDIIAGKYSAWLKAAALGTVDPAWTEEKIDELWPSEWVEKVGERVMEISGIKAVDEEIESFRGDR